MLTKLIESRSKFAGSGTGTAASVAIHLVLITVVAYVTTARAIVEQEDKESTRINWVRPQAPVHVHRSENASRRPATSATRSIAAPTPVSLAISADIPAITVELAIGRPDDDLAAGVSPAASNESRSAPIGESSQPFDAREVDTPASVLVGQAAPVYPPSLRAAGIEGRVIAQFIVDARGRAMRDTIRIVSSSNVLFAESVKRAIAEMHFAPARIGTKPVSQVVQQLFVFRLDR